MNVVSYATSANFMLRLTINGEFFGYIENEQVFLDAENSVMQRVNYFGSGHNIELVPEFAIANIGSNETLTRDQVANAILMRSNFNLVYAHGFFIDGELYGAVMSADLSQIRDTLSGLLDAHRSDDPDIRETEDIDFVNQVVLGGSDLFLAESVVDPRLIITMITSTTRHGQPYLPVVVSRIEERYVDVPYEVIERADDNRAVGNNAVVQQGVLGVNRVTVKVTEVSDSDEEIVTVISTAVVSEPVSRIVHRGTIPRAPHVSTQIRDIGRFIWPIEDSNGRPSGTRSRGISNVHSGLDIAAPRGTTIVAGGCGEVIFARHNNGTYGHTVIILHEDGMQTLYSHLDTIIVREGVSVNQGQRIGTVGRTGRATGYHLHFEVIEAGGNRRLNPENFVSKNS
jgi:murein DD-endopeptidase MepM/ murein hydrolase activator NlpD